MRYVVVMRVVRATYEVRSPDISVLGLYTLDMGSLAVLPVTLLVSGGHHQCSWSACVHLEMRTTQHACFPITTLILVMRNHTVPSFWPLR